MAWIELHNTLPDHWKILRLASIAKVDDPDYARAKLENLWLWALDRRETGDLTGLSAPEIAYASRWRGDPNAWLIALVEAGFIDDDKNGGLKIHDWKHYAGRLLETREYNRKKSKRLRQIRKQNRTRYGTGDVPGTKGHNQTKPNQTEPNQTRREERSGADAPPPSSVGMIDKPPESTEEFGPDQAVESFLMAKARAARIPGKPETTRSYVRAWIARSSGDKVEQVLMDPWSRGKTVIEIQDHFFGKNGEQKGSVDRLLEWARGEDKKREAKDASKS